MATEKDIEHTFASDNGPPPSNTPRQHPSVAKGWSNGDAALELLQSTGPLQHPIDPQRNRRIVRRIDLHIMPLICIGYFLQYIDKVSISYASITGLRESAHLHGNQFNWVASIFFFGQLAFEFPTIRLLQMFPLAKYVSINVTIWGGVLAALQAVNRTAAYWRAGFFWGLPKPPSCPLWCSSLLSSTVRKNRHSELEYGSACAALRKCLEVISRTALLGMSAET